MEESLSLLEKLKKTFSCQEMDIHTYSPLTLAFIGDAVFDLVIRTIIVERGNRSPGALHHQKSAIVRASTQALLAECLLEDMTQEEETVYKRGRNAKSYTSAKNASITDYRKATGFEALLGYLFLTGQEDRLIERIRTSLERCNLQV